MRFTAELEGFDEILRVLDNKTLNKRSYTTRINI